MLSVIIENRLLQLYQAHLDREYQRKWKKLDQELLCYQDEASAIKPVAVKAKKNKKKNKGKKKKQGEEGTTKITAKNILEEISEDPDKLEKM